MSEDRCPAATGIGTTTVDLHGPGEPHRCMMIAAHIGLGVGDHLCSCGKKWTSGPSVGEQTEAALRRRGR